MTPSSALLSLSLLLIGTAGDPPPPPSPPAAADPAPLVAGMNRFAIELHHALGTEGGNLCASPYSVAVALAMSAEGARGETREEMRRVLHLPEGESGPLHAELRARIEAGLEPPPAAGAERELSAIEWALANRIWHEPDLPIEPAFLSTSKERYGAAPEVADFRADPEAARLRINAWVSETTRGKIAELIPAGVIDRVTSLVLVNALFLSAPWAEAFRAEATKPLPFHAATGAVEVPFLRRTGSYSVGAIGSARIIEMPYAGEALAMAIMLPEEGTSLAAVEAALDAGGLAAAFARLEERSVELAVPKFRIRSPAPLDAALRGLGMVAAFDSERADFTGIARVVPPLFIGTVRHEGFIAVDEKGTEAAAATAVVLKRASEEPDGGTFIADRPFLFLIRHRATGVILFLGRVADPR